MVDVDISDIYGTPQFIQLKFRIEHGFGANSLVIEQSSICVQSDRVIVCISVVKVV